MRTLLLLLCVSHIRDFSLCVQEAQKSSAALAAAVEALNSATAAAADEQSRGARDLDEAAQAIERSLQGFEQHGNPKASAGACACVGGGRRSRTRAEDVVISCRGIAGSTAALMSACNVSDPAAVSVAAKQVRSRLSRVGVARVDRRTPYYRSPTPPSACSRTARARSG